jgi:coenzyme F420-0:L-glutamate ligase/coenzyme F420-1:gamma-L-glutamate ligase
VVTHKVVAKVEGCAIDLRTVEPSAFARAIAERWDKDARQVEVVLRESARIVRMDRGVLICETRHGYVCANAGVDRSNAGAPETVLTLPRDPDASAQAIRAAVARIACVQTVVIVGDTFGRPWREGLTNVALGCAGLRPLRDERGHADAHGYVLGVSVLAVADELCAAAELVMGKLRGVPAAVVRGYAYEAGEGSARELLRAPETDMFR